jgi:carbon monoxide dehydrogenase subunit G
VTLVADGDTTILTYDAKAQISGKLAQLGSRLIQSTAKKLAAKFFKSFADVLDAEQVG